ncbi:MAG: tyrosine--tRNA ligase [Bacteroidetes bacterium]|nr:tyrosine--tRNA ligase [Bacteroidota bacterium]
MSFSPNYNLVEELRWRGLVHDTFPETENVLQKEQISGYVGFDPTADSLHVGNLVAITLLRKLQKAGHKPFALVGGATGMIGDPSGKSAERNLLDLELLQRNQAAIKKQLEKFLDFESKTNAAQMVNNYDWFKEFKFLDFIREVGKHISISYMMAKDSVKNRLETGISFTEFSYQLIQGYDFYYLYKNHGVKLQMGGSDQWGNITTGTELIRRMGGGEAYALTAPLLTKADGTKFGKSEGGNVWLDSNKTSPYTFYQFWLNVSDEDAEKLIKVFTEFSRAQTTELIDQHRQEPHLRLLQKTLAKELTTLVHSASDYETSVKASQILFGNADPNELLSLGEKTFLSAMEGVPTFSIAKEKLRSGIHILDLLAVETSVFPSKGEARKMIQANALSFNKQKHTDSEAQVNKDNLIFEKFLLVQKGKKNYFLIEVR